MYRNKNRNTVTKSVVGQLHFPLRKKKKKMVKKEIKSSQKKRHIRQRNEHKDDSRLVRNNVSQTVVQQVYKMGTGDNTVRIMY